MFDRPARAAGRGIALAASLFSANVLASPPASPPTPASAAPEEPPPPISVDLGVRVGPGVRLDEPPSLAIAERTFATFAVAAGVTPSRGYSLGLAYEHSGFGRETSTYLEPGYLEMSRSLDALWASFRAHLVSNDLVRLSLLVGAGLAWQSATTSAAYSTSISAPLKTFSCSVSDSPGLGLRAGLGVEMPTKSGVFLSADALFDSLQLSSDVLDGCALGAGSATTLSARFGIGYRFDVTHSRR